MRTIGMIGGMSWESTITYYTIINEVIKKELGGLHSAQILLYSVDFQIVEKYLSTGEWDKNTALLIQAAQSLERAGADFILICTNTMHKVVPQIQAEIHVPILHIAEAVAEELKRNNICRAALLGTKYTMLEDFYKAKLMAAGVEVLIPDEDGVQFVNHVIYNELCLGVISETSRRGFLQITGQLEKQGAQGIVLGCTEIGLLIKPSDLSLPVFDTTQIHAVKAAMMSI